MRYPGGKTRSAKQICEVLKQHGCEGPYWEPFCGGLGISPTLVRYFGPGDHSDCNQAIISLYLATKAGWDPPEIVSEEEYRLAKSLPDTDPMKAYCGVAGSFGGKWFGGYARSEGRNILGEGRKSLLRDVPLLSNIFVFSFLESTPNDKYKFIYLDPPYEGTLPYKGAPPFDSVLFWQKAEKWAKYCKVFVSEYKAPEYWKCVWSKQQKTTIAIGNYKQATERLFTLG